jgi:hypothetical protein
MKLRQVSFPAGGAMSVLGEDGVVRVASNPTLWIAVGGGPRLLSYSWANGGTLAGVGSDGEIYVRTTAQGGWQSLGKPGGRTAKHVDFDLNGAITAIADEGNTDAVYVYDGNNWGRYGTP